MSKLRLVFLLCILLALPASQYANDCGDVNGDAAVNIGDAVFLVNYIFRSGPEPDCGPVTDIDGNVYGTVIIGDQVWMVENLQVTHYRNGDPIPIVTNTAIWAALSSGGCCNYQYDEHNVAVYGRLYNWYAVNDSRGIAPEGWHVPTDEEWKQLEMYLGMSQSDADATEWRGTDEGGKLKDTGIVYWDGPNSGATNESGFSALPGGYCHSNGLFSDEGAFAYFWSVSELSTYNAWNRYLGYHTSGIGRYDYGKQGGNSVRCVKD